MFPIKGLSCRTRPLCKPHCPIIEDSLRAKDSAVGPFASPHTSGPDAHSISLLSPLQHTDFSLG